MAVAVKVSAVEQAEKFVAECKKYGWSWWANFQRVTIEKRFAAGDKAAYSDCDMDAYSILALAPLKGGSIWGTDGGSIGGMTGLNGGYYRLNKSGSGSRFLKALAKLS